MSTVHTDDDVAIDYTMVGTGPTTLVFMHGWGGAGSGHSWGELLRHLDLTGLRALLVDLRGHGRSTPTTLGYTTDRFARDVLAVADDAGAEQFVVVAYSMSGKTAQWLACTAPERVLGQILIGPVPASELPIPDEVRAQWLQMARSPDSKLFTQVLRPFIKDPLSPELVERYFYDMSHAARAAQEGTLDMMQIGSFVDRLPSTRAATLVMAGAHDALMPVEVLREAIVAPIPGARMAVLDCGHEIPLEQPQVAAALIEAFLAGLGRTKASIHIADGAVAAAAR